MLNTVDALVDCLERPGGCAVVPGLPADQYNLTLGTSILGGLVAGYASRLQPDGTIPELSPVVSVHVHIWLTCSVRVVERVPTCSAMPENTATHWDIVRLVTH